jgi:hypothetical protein
MRSIELNELLAYNKWYKTSIYPYPDNCVDYQLKLKLQLKDLKVYKVRKGLKGLPEGLSAHRSCYSNTW